MDDLSSANQQQLKKWRSIFTLAYFNIAYIYVVCKSKLSYLVFSCWFQLRIAIHKRDWRKIWFIDRSKGWEACICQCPKAMWINRLIYRLGCLIDQGIGYISLLGQPCVRVCVSVMNSIELYMDFSRAERVEYLPYMVWSAHGVPMVCPCAHGLRPSHHQLNPITDY